MRVLLAEDYNDLREGLKLALEQEGWEVVAAEDGIEALRLFNEVTETGRYFDVLLLDVVMPRMGGIEVGINIRGREKVFPEMPRAVHIYLTGYDKDLRIDGEDLVAISFADAYITKPVGPDELIKKMKELVEQKK